MKIRVRFDNVRLRRTAEFAGGNVIKLLPAGAEVEGAKLSGDWWQVPGGFVHASMIETVETTPDNHIGIPSEQVPYRSQWDNDANNRTSDCGQTCVAMLAEWRGVKVNVNDLRFQSSASGLSTADDLIANLKSVGLSARKVVSPIGETPSLPAICQMWYGGLLRENVQDKKYKGWHWVVLLEVKDTQVITHDPDFWPPRRGEGAFKAYSLDEWKAAFIPFDASTKTTAVVLA